MESKVKNYINGQFVDSEGSYFPKVSPLTLETLYQCPNSTARDAHAAISAARAALSAWRRLSPLKRAEYILKVTTLLEARKTELAEVNSANTGKNIKSSLGEIQGAINQGQFTAGEGARSGGTIIPSSVAGRQVMVVHEPVGVCLLIPPSNSPFPNIAWKLFPALIYGNTVVIKSSEDAPIIANLFMEVCHEAGIPAGVVNMLHGLGQDTGSELINDARFDLISFTGSTRVGRLIQEATSKRFTRTFLEMGGKNPFVILKDADLKNAVEWAVNSAFGNAGQRCSSASRIIVEESIYDQFKDSFLKRATALKLGHDDQSDIGPVMNKRQLEGLLAIINETKKEAKLICGGQSANVPGYPKGLFLEPTVFEDISPEAKLSREEFFGPLTCLYRAKNFEHAIELANNSHYGLTSAVHTKDINLALEFSRRVEAGIVSINAGSFGSEPHMPFGGLKDSGNGLREPGSAAINIYTNTKNVSLSIYP